MFEDRQIYEIIIEAMENKKPLENYSVSEIKKINGDFLSSCVPKFAEIALQKIKENAVNTLAKNRNIENEFVRHIWTAWSDAFDLLQIFLESCVEAGNEFNKEVFSNHSEDEKYLLMALIGLHARGCGIGFEIFTLLKNGFPDGAHARWRTLYEITVIAKFISENGNEAAKRYILHDIIESFRGIEDYQKYCEIHGYKPFSEEKIACLKKDQEDMIHLFGKGFKDDYGWASDILRKKNLSLSPEFKANFREIERATNLEYMHPYYQMANLNVHAGSKSLTFRLGRPIESKAQSIHFGACDNGFTDPANGTSIALYALTSILLIQRQNIYRLITINILKNLRDEIGNTFFEIDKRLQNRNSFQDK